MNVNHASFNIAHEPVDDRKNRRQEITHMFKISAPMIVFLTPINLVISMSSYSDPFDVQIFEQNVPLHSIYQT